MYLMICPVLCCSWLFNGFLMRQVVCIGDSVPSLTFSAFHGCLGGKSRCSGGPGTRGKGAGLFWLARGRRYGTSSRSIHVVELRGVSWFRVCS
jgi:hypothetical protein